MAKAKYSSTQNEHASIPGGVHFDWRHQLLMASVVLVTIDRARSTILLTIDLTAFSRSQSATVGGALVVDFFMDGGFAAFHASRFACGHLAAAYALRDAFLLIALPLADFTFWIHILCLGIMLLPVDVF